jgi:hypothetical protein
LLSRSAHAGPVVPLDLSVPHALLFARGFVLGDGFEPWAPDGWASDAFSGWSLKYDAGRVPLRRAVHDGVEVVALGVLFDVRDPESDPQATVASLAASLAGSESAFLDELAWLNGRHAIFYRRGDGRSFVLGDAAGIRSIFRYSRERRIIASHVNLVVANAAEAEPGPVLPYRFGYAGLRTPRRHVFFVTPNTKLDLGNFRIERFWPTAPIPQGTLQDAAGDAAALMAGAFAWIAGHYHPVISVTAGIDSRTTLAVSRGSASRYYTYYRNGNESSDALDRDFGLLLQRSGLVRHTVLEVSATPARKAEIAALWQNTFYPHLFKATSAHVDAFGGDPLAIHVRSNLSEIARQFYAYRRGENPPAGTPEELARLWQPLYESDPAWPIIVDAFAEFIVTTGFTACAPMIDLPTLFYWEHRMGIWHSQVVMSTDLAFDTVSLYNCRRLLEVLLSVPPDLQRKGTVLKEIIRRLWPALASFPINGKPFDQYRE